MQSLDRLAPLGGGEVLDGQRHVRRELRALPGRQGAEQGRRPTRRGQQILVCLGRQVHLVPYDARTVGTRSVARSGRGGDQHTTRVFQQPNDRPQEVLAVGVLGQVVEHDHRRVGPEVVLTGRRGQAGQNLGCAQEGRTEFGLRSTRRQQQPQHQSLRGGGPDTEREPVDGQAQRRAGLVGQLLCQRGLTGPRQPVQHEDPSGDPQSRHQPTYLGVPVHPRLAHLTPSPATPLPAYPSRPDSLPHDLQRMSPRHHPQPPSLPARFQVHTPFQQQRVGLHVVVQLLVPRPRQPLPGDLVAGSPGVHMYADSYFARWEADGVFDQLTSVLRGKVRQAEGRTSQPSPCLIDTARASKPPPPSR